jgi:hypothetical protein
MYGINDSQPESVQRASALRASVGPPSLALVR